MLIRVNSDSKSISNLGMLLLTLYLFIKFVPFPVIKIIRFAPENIIVLLMGVYLFFNFSRFARLKRRIVAVLVLMGLFFVLECLFAVLHGELFKIPISSLRMLLSMLFIIIVCETEGSLLFAIKFFLGMTVVSVLFGLLVYLFGEPFSSVRQWFVQSTSNATTLIGKGSQLSGIGILPHVFGYYMAATPILCYSLFQAERKIIWILCLLVCCVGLFLNAERSALLFNVIVFFVILWRGKNRLLHICIFAVCLCAVLGTGRLIENVISGTSSQKGAVLVAGNLTERMKSSSADDFAERIKWQMHGIKAVLKYPLSGVTKQAYAEEVYGGKYTYISARRANIALDPHNNYVNAGIRAGIWGWLILVLLFFPINAMLKYSFQRTNIQGSIATVAFGVKLSVIAVSGNALFHNAGIFDGEFATCTVLAFLMATYNIASDIKPKESDSMPLSCYS